MASTTTWLVSVTRFSMEPPISTQCRIFQPGPRCPKRPHMKPGFLGRYGVQSPQSGGRAIVRPDNPQRVALRGGRAVPCPGRSGTRDDPLGHGGHGPASRASVRRSPTASTRKGSSRFPTRLFTCIARESEVPNQIGAIHCEPQRKPIANVKFFVHYSCYFPAQNSLLTVKGSPMSQHQLPSCWRRATSIAYTFIGSGPETVHTVCISARRNARHNECRVIHRRPPSWS
jgi:hypothetical protein